MASRGNAVSAYIPAFAKGAQIYGANVASGTITSAHIADGTVIAADIAAGSVTSAKIGTGAVVEVKIGAAAVTSAKIGTGAVVEAKIGAAAVTSAKIGAAAVTSAKIGTAAVTNAKIGAGAVTSAKIGTNAIRNSGFISAAAVVASKLKYQVISATVANSGVVYSLAHTLGRTPAFVLFSLYGTVSQLKGVATSAGSVGAPTVSAHTSAVIYYAGAKNARFRAFVMI